MSQRSDDPQPHTVEVDSPDRGFGHPGGRACFLPGPDGVAEAVRSARAQESLLQALRRPGWVGAAMRECIRSRRYMPTPFVAWRFLRDGWKILRLTGHKPPRFLAKIAGHIPPGQFLRYILVGVWNTVFGYATFAGLTAALDPYVSQSYLPAVVIGSPVSFTMAFLCYKWFVFHTKGNYLREWVRCLAVYGSGTVGSLVILPIAVWALRYGAGMRQSAPYVAGAILTGCGVIYNFIGHRKFSFRNASELDTQALIVQR